MPQIITIICTILSALSIISCGNINVELTGEEAIIHKEQAFEYTSPKYEIGASDVLGLTLLHSPTKSKTPYLIQIGDSLRVEFPHYPEYDRSLLVRTDGYITLPLTGEILAAGVSPSQLATDIHQKQSNKLSHPYTTVTMEKINTVIERFKQTMRSNNFGQTRIVTVRPDGHASIPLIGEMRFSGKLISTAENEIRDQFKEMLGNIEISLNVRSANSNLFYVMGWVRKPGFYKLTGPTTVMQGLAIAGGFRDDAQSSDIILISRNKDKHPTGKIINADNIIGTGDIGNDSFINQYDIIYVPPTAFAKGAVIGQEIWTMIPFRFSMSYLLNEY